MGNRRIIILFLIGIAFCLAVLWYTRKGFRWLPAENETRVMLVDSPLDNADGLSVSRGTERFSLLRSDDGWELLEPFVAAADGSVVQRLLDSFEDAKVEDALFFDELRRRGLSLLEFGLAPPKAKVTINAGKTLMTVAFGTFTPSKSGVYARLGEHNQVLILPASLFNVLPVTADDLRVRRLLNPLAGRIKSIEIRSPGRPFVSLQREGNRWMLRQPSSAVAMETRVAMMLEAVETARSESFVWPAATAESDGKQQNATLETRRGLYGLDEERGVFVQVQQEQSDNPVRWVFGSASADRPNCTYVLMDGGRSIGVVSNRVAEVFRVSPDELRDWSLFPELKSGLTKLRVTMDDTDFAMTQTGGVWQLESPLPGRADQSAVREAVSGLLSLKASGTSPRNETSPDIPEEFAAKHKVTFKVADDQREWDFTVSNDTAEPDTLLLAFAGNPVYYRIAQTNFPAALLTGDGLNSLHDKQVLALDPASLRRIIRSYGDSVSEQVERTDANSPWKPATVERTLNRKNFDRFAGLLANLRAVRVEKLGVAADDLDRCGLRQPWMTVSVDVDAEDAVRKILALGGETSDGGRFALLRGQNLVFVLDAEAVGVLSAAFFE